MTINRRSFLGHAATGLSSMALLDLLQRDRLLAAQPIFRIDARRPNFFFWHVELVVDKFGGRRRGATRAVSQSDRCGTDLGERRACAHAASLIAKRDSVRDGRGAERRDFPENESFCVNRGLPRGFAINRGAWVAKRGPAGFTPRVALTAKFAPCAMNRVGEVK